MILPEFFLATSILVITLHGSLVATSKVLGFPLLLKSFNRMSILILGFTLILANNNSASFLIVYSSSFIFDLLTLNVKQLVLFSAILCLFISEQPLRFGQINQFEYFILILCSILGLLFLTSSFDLLSLYLAIEMQSLCFYVLAAAKKDSSFSTEAGLKYFIIGSFSSGLLLLGISFLYGCTGTTHFDNFSLLFSEINSSYSFSTSLIEKALLCIIIAFFFQDSCCTFPHVVTRCLRGFSD
jgi:NADH:ubiquinone oxidoreductase subunit 2 (subunit N)